MKDNDNQLDLFTTMSIPRAVIKVAIPAMVAMLFTMIYNLADTYFIGLTHDDMQVAAVSLCTPLFQVFTAVGTVFGMGGSSLISRSMGSGKLDQARRTSSYCMWMGLGFGVIVLILYFIFMNPLLSLLGASEGSTWDFAKQYLQMIAIAGPFAVVPSAFANIIRCEGKSTIAAAGMIGGNILNIILDPILILALGMGTRGAGLATLISMICATLFYVGYFYVSKSMLSIKLKDFSGKGGIASSVFAIGIPAALGSLMITISTIIMQSLIAGYNDNALAGVGIALKVLMISTLLAGGIGQGVQAILGYCVGANLWDRFRKCLRFTLIFAFIFCLVLALLCYAFTEPICRLFLTGTDSISYAVEFSRIMLWTSPLVGMFYVCQNTTLAMGLAGRGLVLNLSRQGFVLIPFIFIMKAIIGYNGILWAQPISDIISLALALFLLLTSMKKMSAAAPEHVDIDTT